MTASPNPVIAKLQRGAPLGAEDEAAILSSLDFRAHDRRSPDLVQEGDPADGLLAVLEGFVCRYRDLENGRRQILALLLPGDTCDVRSSLLRRIDHNVGVLSRCRLAIVPRATVQGWLAERPAIRLAFECSALVDEAILREWLVNVGARPAAERTAHLLCELHARLDAVGLARGGSFSLPLTQEELANMLGLSIVHVNRVLGGLREGGLATFRGGQVDVHDLPRLAALAGFKPNYLHFSFSTS